MSFDIGGPNKEKSSSGANSATKAKTGSTNVKTYDPKNTGDSGGGSKPSVTGKYSPAGNDTPSAPGK